MKEKSTMEAKLVTNITIRELCENFTYNKLEEKGIYGLNNKLIIQPEYQRNYIYESEKKGCSSNREYT